MYGLGVQGPVSDNLQINLAYAQLDIDKMNLQDMTHIMEILR